MKISFLLVKLIMITLVLQIDCALLAQNKYYYLKLGSNISEFRNQETAMRKGLVIGAGLSYDAKDFSFANGFVNLEVLYTLKRAIIENKTWSTVPEIGVEPKGVIGDINSSLSYVEFDLKTGYCINVTKKVKIGVFLGPAFSLPLVNKSKKIYNDYFELDNNTKLDYERYIPDDSSIPIYLQIVDKIINTEFHFIMGAIMKWDFINLELGYSHALSDVKDLKNAIWLDIHEKLDSYFFSVGISF